MAQWELLESLEPDISTEQLFARVMDMTGAEYDEIVGALVADSERD
jgi:ligand-binding sensor domain-containing protein